MSSIYKINPRGNQRGGKRWARRELRLWHQKDPRANWANAELAAKIIIVPILLRPD